jgi:S1-C subfamily serine protease
MFRTIAAAAALAVLRLLPAAAAEPDGAALVERYAPAVVGLRLTLRSEVEGSGAPPEESTDETVGVVVDPSGLILLWNSHVSSGRMTELFAEMGGQGGFRLRVSPTDVRVTIPGEGRERQAFLAAADSDLDLAFVQLEELPEAPLASIDFAQAAEVRIGETLAAVSRLSSSFDRAPFFDLVRVVGRVAKPRAAWILGGGNATQAGLPYFAADGRPAGVLVTVVSRAGEATTPDASRLFAEMLSLGRGQSEVGPIGLFLLPAEVVRGRVELARERARELLAERGAGATPGDG